MERKFQYWDTLFNVSISPGLTGLPLCLRSGPHARGHERDEFLLIRRHLTFFDFWGALSHQDRIFVLKSGCVCRLALCGVRPFL